METSTQKQLFTVPMSIVVAGALIAGAIYLAGVGTGGRSDLPAAPAEPSAPPVTPAPTVGAIRPIGPADHVRGATTPTVTLIEYSDLECPFCKRFHVTLQQLLAEYPTQVQWVYRHYPIEQLHSQASKEAEAVECAAEQGKFWELTDKIYEVTPSNDGLDLKQLPTLAREVGVANIPQFEQCLSTGKYAARIAEDLVDAEASGATQFGTPYSVLLKADGTKVPFSGAQPYTSLKKAVEELL